MSVKGRINKIESRNRSQKHFLYVTSKVTGFNDELPVFENIEDAIDRTCEEIGITREDVSHILFWGGEPFDRQFYDHAPALQRIDYGGYHKVEDLVGYRSLEEMLESVWSNADPAN